MTPEELKKKWANTFENPTWSVSKFRKKTFASEACSEGFRSICWKLYLEVLPELDTNTWPLSLNKSRAHYGGLRKRLIDIPREALSKLQQEADHAKVNPLAPEKDNPWTQFFQDGELRKIIIQDVERTFPDLELFRRASIQTMMTDILFVYCKLHSANSYRQGMHELLAPMVYVLEADATASPNLFPSSDKGKAIKMTLDPNYIEHDSYTLFERLMRGAGPWFEAPGPDEAARLARAHRARKQTSLIRALNYPPKSSTPILSLCYRMYYTHLAACDPPLFSHLERLEIEPQLFGLRWFRLLFSREMPFSSALIVWDGILNYSPDLNLVEFVALALLLFLRDQIVEQDYSSTLQCLMRPPKLHSPHTLLRQAAQLAAQPGASTGYQVGLENYKFKGIHPAMLPPFPVEATDKAPVKPGRPRTNSTGNIPVTVVKSSPSSLGPRSDLKPKSITLAQVGELDAQLIVGLEQCIKWIQSEPNLKCQNAIQGLQCISLALKGRTAVIGGQAFKGDHRFGFPSSALASVLEKEEPWEFVSRPGNEAAPLLEPTLNADSTTPPKTPIATSKAKNLTQQKETERNVSTGKANAPASISEANPSSSEVPDAPAESQSSVLAQSSTREESFSPEATSPNIPNCPKEGSFQKPMSNSAKANVDTKKLKQVREQYDWIFGSDQNKPQRTKSSKSMSVLASSFASCDPLGALSTGTSAEDFLSTLRTPPRPSHRKSPSLSSSQELPSIIKTLNPDSTQPPSNSFTTSELPKSESQPWPVGHSSSQNEFVDVMFSTPQDKPLIPPPRPSDEFFSNPW